MSAACIGSYELVIHSPVFDQSGSLFVCTSSGDVLRVNGNPHQDREVRFSFVRSAGEAVRSMCLDENGCAYVCSDPSRAIKAAQLNVQAGVAKPVTIAQGFEGLPFSGPSAVCIHVASNVLFLADCGPQGSAKLGRRSGSLYCVSKSKSLVPIALDCLTDVRSLVVSDDGNSLFVADTSMNRILRFYQYPTDGAWQGSVFLQLSGRYGPTALAFSRDSSSSQSGRLYIAQSDFPSSGNSSGSRMMVVDASDATILKSVTIPKCPDINGLTISADAKHLFFTESSSCSLTRIPNPLL